MKKKEKKKLALISASKAVVRNPTKRALRQVKGKRNIEIPATQATYKSLPVKKKKVEDIVFVKGVPEINPASRTGKRTLQKKLEIAKKEAAKGKKTARKKEKGLRILNSESQW